MSSDRLKRYVAAVDHVLISVAAKAAMAVADAERNEELVEWAKAAHKLLAENERLRIELADAELAQTNDNLKQVYDETCRLAGEENARLRAELNATRRAKQETDDRHAATIADLRNALEERYEHRGVDDLANSIYGVLERDSND